MANYIEVNSTTDQIVGLHLSVDSEPEAGTGFEMIEITTPPENGFIAFQVWDRDNSEIIDTPASLSVKYKWELESSDWKVLRHRDQVDAGVTTSLTDEEYQALLTQRQTWRDGCI